MHLTVTCNLQSATCTWSCPCFLLPLSLSCCVPYHTYSRYLCRAVRLHISQQHCSCGGPCSTALLARRRGQRFFSSFLCEMRSDIPIWLGVMGAAGSPPISFASRLRAAAAGPEDGARGRGGRAPRPAHFVMLTNPLTVHARPRKSLLFTRRLGWRFVDADRSGKGKSTTTRVSSQLGRSLA